MCFRLRFSRTNFFYEWTFVDARWSVFGSHVVERSFGLARGPWEPFVHGATLEVFCWRLSCPGEQQWKKRQHELSTWREAWKTILLKFQTPYKWRKSETIRLFCAMHRVLWLQASSDRWRLRKYLARSCLADIRCDKIVHGRDYMLFVCSLRSLPSSQPIHNAQPHPRCSDRHKEGAGAGSFSNSDVSLTTNDMEQSSSAGICSHDKLAIQWRLQSQINAQVRQATFKDVHVHRSWCSGKLRQATDRFTLVDEEIIDLVYDRAREVQFAGDNGVVNTLHDEAD